MSLVNEMKEVFQAGYPSGYSSIPSPYVEMIKDGVASTTYSFVNHPTLKLVMQPDTAPFFKGSVPSGEALDVLWGWVLTDADLGPILDMWDAAFKSGIFGVINRKGVVTSRDGLHSWRQAGDGYESYQWDDIP